MIKYGAKFNNQTCLFHICIKKKDVGHQQLTYEFYANNISIYNAHNYYIIIYMKYITLYKYNYTSNCINKHTQLHKQTQTQNRGTEQFSWSVRRIPIRFIT